ncbi:acetoin utilization deacetylase AcuC-like enzyme [Mesonia algae]|uniref:Acetoin utilization deacetylase AcuC-like enzyme n=1 Tax=Mesonia algae TaxID=213248 RepID=A0A2W7ICR7_9FLAO|nr:histone deacetylase [Mesonia algae]PZW43898.1 acetoin utilization deacetylase AcuC-like enzyme [Mesonia algae]
MLKIAFHPSYIHPLPAKHRFPMEKYELLPQQLLYEGTCEPDNFFEPEILNDKYILAVHDAEYYYDFLNLKLTQKEIRRTGFPLSRSLVERERLIAGGTVQAALYALEHGAAMNIAGGTHHAYTDRGEGFCMLNDQAIAAQYLLDKGLAKKILIVDLDVHQGNGTAEIFQNNPAVFTFSMHGEKNYPFRKEKSDLDIGLPNGTNDEAYLAKLKEILPNLLEKVKPDFVFYLSGVDVLATDKLGKLSLSIDGCKERDRFVLQNVRDKNLPIQISMGGGYSEEIKHIVEAHANTYRLTQYLYM